MGIKVIISHNSIAIIVFLILIKVQISMLNYQYYLSCLQKSIVSPSKIKCILSRSNQANLWSMILKRIEQVLEITLHLYFGLIVQTDWGDMVVDLEHFFAEKPVNIRMIHRFLLEIVVMKEWKINFIRISKKMTWGDPSFP